jgi:hypothetical protein
MFSLSVFLINSSIPARKKEAVHYRFLVPTKYKTVNCYSNRIIKLPDTAAAFRRRFRSSRRSTLTPLWSFTDTLASLVDISFRNLLRLVISRSPIIWNSVIHPSYRKSTNHIPHQKSSYSLRITIPRNPFSADACRPKSAWAPDTSHKVEQVPPCIYTGRNLLGIWHPQAPASSALWTKKQSLQADFIFCQRLGWLRKNFVSQLFP